MKLEPPYNGPMEPMPARADAELAARGGAPRWRTVTLPDGRRGRAAVVRRPGPRGGRVVIVKIIK